MKDQSYSKRSIKCWAVIAEEEYDVVQVSFDFSLNSIPNATASIAFGRDVNLASSSAYAGRAAKINEKFLFRKEIKVFASCTVSDEDKELAESGAAIPGFENKLIFHGYIAGFGYQRTASGTALSISIEHWLADLAAASMIGTGTHYAMPADLQRAAVLSNKTITGLEQAGQAPTNGAAIMPRSWFAEGTDVSAVTSNLWENGIKKMMVKSASRDNMVDLNNLIDYGACRGSYINNQAALSALKKTTSKKTPLAMRTLTSDIANLANNVFNNLTKTYLENLGGQTLWDNIINTSADLMYAVVPHIESAEVVPFCPTTTDDVPFASISADQIESVNISGDCPRVIRGVGIVYKQSDLMIPVQGGISVVEGGLRLAGKYVNNSLGCKGIILFKHPPLWLGTDFNGRGSGRGLSMEPTSTVNPAPKQDEDPNKPTEENVNSAPDAYAKALYGHEVIKGRQGTISGPLRFDIGVGSVIEFELPVDYHTSAEMGSRYFYGIVIRVSSVLDAGSASASTAFTVAHIRTYAEEWSAEGFMLDHHPIYHNKWMGARLDEPVPADGQGQ